MRTSSSTRRAFLSVLAASGVTACASFSRTSPFWGTIYAGVSPPETARISRAYVDELPYASMAAWFEGAPRSLLVLAELQPNNLQVWYSAEGQAITTNGPFVVRSIGTELELRGSSFVPHPDDLRRADGVKIDRVLDVWADNERIRFAVHSHFKAGSIDEIKLLGQPRRLRRIIEQVSAGHKPRYRNDYWIDEADGYCWKSRQIVVPTLPHLNIEILKRPHPSS